VQDNVDTGLRLKADIAILNANIVNVCTKEIIRDSIAIKSDKIIRVGDVRDIIGVSTTVVDAKDAYVSPGFIDAHIHIESSMLTITEFAKAALPHGTTSVVIDPHEIANVLGMAGVKLFLEESANLPLKVFITAPSCVPAAAGFETSGAELTPENLEELLRVPRVVGLGEVMNYLGVIQRDPVMLRKIRIAHSLRKRVDGHAPMLRGRELAAYVSAGIHSDHECVEGEEAIEKLRLGMWIMAREGSAAKNLHDIIRTIRKKNVETRHIMLVTDDLSPIDLVKGYIDRLVKAVIDEGYDPVTAIQMATINPAAYFHLDHSIGFIAPGFNADVVLFEDLDEVKVKKVISNGKIVAKNGKFTERIIAWRYPLSAEKTVKVKSLPRPEDFAVKVPEKLDKVTVRVMRIEDRSLLTKSETDVISVKNGVAVPDVEKDVLQVVVVERHKATGNIGRGFVRGFNLSEGALASSVAHDSHNIVVVGASWNDMAVAVRKIVNACGGIVAVKGGKVLAFLNLPIAGLMSKDDAEKVSLKLTELNKAAKKMGCKLTEPFMTMSFIALPVIPELKLTDRGLVERMNFVSPIIG